MTAGEGIAYLTGATVAANAIFQFLKNKKGNKRSDFNTLKDGYIELYEVKSKEYEQIKKEIELIKKDIEGNEKARKELLAIISPFELKMDALSEEIDKKDEEKLNELIKDTMKVLSSLKDFL